MNFAMLNLDDLSPISTFIFITSAFFLYFLLNKWRKSTDVIIPRAEGALPILGNILDFAPSKVLKTFLAYPKKYGKLVEFYLLGTRSILVSDLGMAKDILFKRPKKFGRLKSAEYGRNVLKLNSGLFSSNGKEWSKIRRLTSPSFSSSNIQKKAHYIVKETIDWSKDLRDKCNKNEQQQDKVHNFLEEITYLTVRVITTVAFNVPDDHPVRGYFISPAFQFDINRALKVILAHIMFPFPKFLWKYSPMYKYEVEAVESNERFIAKCREVLEYKKQLFLARNDKDNEGVEKAQVVLKEGMIDNFLALSIDHKDEFDENELIANIQTMYIAGSETTQSTICWAVYYMLKYPEMMRKAREEAGRVLFPDASHHPWNEDSVDKDDYSSHYTMELIKQSMPYTNNIVQEILRLCGPIFSMALSLEEGEEYTFHNGLTVSSDDEIRVNIDAIHRDPEVFVDPEQFNPDRWDKNHTYEEHLKKMHDHILAFGAGPRLCPGIHLAKYEAVIAIALIIYLFDLEIDGSIDDVQRVVILTATLNQLKVKVKPRF